VTVRVLATVLSVLTLTFLAAHLPPGDPIDARGEVTPAEREALRRHYGLDRPLPVQFLVWLGRALTLDFGTSLVDGRPVVRKIAERLPGTLLLMGSALALAALLALPIGLRAARGAGGAVDRALGVALLVLYAVPAFWLGTLMLTFLGRGGGFLGWFPVLGPLEGTGPLDRLHHLVLPVVCLGAPLFAVLARQVRAGALEALRAPWVAAARGRGAPPRELLRRHVRPHAAAPLVALTGLLVPRALGGSVVVETLFTLPGIGSLGFEAAARRDLPVVLGLTALTAVATLAGSALSDALLHRLDPRSARP
jgi:peptide/nickel transport system permease protein